LRWRAKPVVEEMLRHLKAAPGVEQVSVAGSYRRAREDVGDVDLIATAEAGTPVIEHFVGHEDVVQVLAKGPTRATVVLRGGLQVDLRVVSSKSYGAALVYFTGSKAHNIAIRRIGQQRGRRSTVWRVPWRPPHRRQTKGSIYRALHLPSMPPSCGKIAARSKRRLPRLTRRPSGPRGDHCLRPPATGAVVLKTWSGGAPPGI
jgi:DNA polymerase (family 10)